LLGRRFFFQNFLGYKGWDICTPYNLTGTKLLLPVEKNVNKNHIVFCKEKKKSMFTQWRCNYNNR